MESVKEFIEFEKLMIGGIYEVVRLPRSEGPGASEGQNQYYCLLRKKIGWDFLRLEGRRIPIEQRAWQYFSDYMARKDKAPLAFAMGENDVYPLTRPGLDEFRKSFGKRIELARDEKLSSDQAVTLLSDFRVSERPAAFFDGFRVARAIANVGDDYLKTGEAAIKVALLKQSPCFGKFFRELAGNEQRRFFQRLDDVERNEMSSKEGALVGQCRYLYNLFLIQFARKRLEQTVLFFVLDTAPRLLAEVFPKVGSEVRARLIGNLNRRVHVFMRNAADELSPDEIPDRVGELLSETILEFLAGESVKRGLPLDKVADSVAARWHDAVMRKDFVSALLATCQGIAISPLPEAVECIKSKKCSPAHRDLLFELQDSRSRLADEHYLRDVRERFAAINRFG